MEYSSERSVAIVKAARHVSPEAIQSRSATRVILVSPCQGVYGGMEAFVLAVAKSLADEGSFKVRIAWKKVRTFHLDPVFKQIVRASLVPSTFVDRSSEQLWRAILWSDVVHCQNASPDVVAMCLASRRPVALTIHNRNRGESFFDFTRRFTAVFAARRWYNSTFVRNTWEGGPTSAKSEVVPTVSDLPQGVVAPASRRGFVFAARWIANKGIETLLSAYRIAALDVERWPLQLLGTGPLSAKIERQLEDDPMPGVHLTGFVDHVRKSEIIQHARWLVAPPHTKEDLGLTPIEARSVGVPSIITRDGGLPEAAGSQALVCEPGDTNGLADLLRRAASMSESEYARRADLCRRELDQFLRPMSFYAEELRELGQPNARRRSPKRGN